MKLFHSTSNHTIFTLSTVLSLIPFALADKPQPGLHSLPSLAPLPGINTKGSSICHRHSGQLKALIHQLEAVPYPNYTVTSTDGADHAIGCINFASTINSKRAHPRSLQVEPAPAHPPNTTFEENFRGYGPRIPIAIPVDDEYVRAASLRAHYDYTSTHNGGGEAICAFYQGTGDASFTLTTTINYLKKLDAAGADPCGSIQINEPYGDITAGGELIVEYVAAAACEGWCGESFVLSGTDGLVNTKALLLEYAPGWCSLHLTWYQRPLDTISSPDPDYYLAAFVYDSNHMLVATDYNLRVPVDTWVAMPAPQLPDALEFWIHNDTSPLRMTYAGAYWNTTQNGCRLGGFNAGKQTVDCGFQCGESLGSYCYDAKNWPPMQTPSTMRIC